jgi:PAS domain S-box-containing protein
MSFRLKTIIGIALIQTVLLIGLIVSGMSYLKRTHELHLQQRIESISILYSHALKDAVLSTDLATIESFVEDSLKIPDIVYVRISNNDHVFSEGGDLTLLSVLKNYDFSLSDVDDSVFDLEIKINNGVQNYAQIEIGLSTQHIERTLVEAQRWAIALAFLVVVLVAIFSYVLGTYLTQSLQRLKKASETIASAGPGHQIEIQGNDEIAEVGYALNHMSSTLAVSYKQLSQSIESERKMTSLARSNQAKNHAILTASLDAIITIDQAGVVVDYSSVAEKIFGWTYNEVFGHCLSDFIIPEQKRHTHHHGIEEYILNKQSAVINQRLQLTAQHKDGHHFPIEINISPIEFAGGIMFTAFIRDVTARLQAETELRLAASTFESSEAIFICNAQANIIRTNHAFTDITGYTNEDVLGKNPSVLSSGQYPNKFYENMWDSLAKEGQWSGEINNKRKDGEIYPEYLNISSIKDAKGEITHYIAHSMDISEQKQNEENLRKARIEADASNESKSRFLASMSHEIRTPMNAVLGILGLLKDSPLNEKQHSLVSTARDSGELLLTIINDILDFTKMDVGKLQLENSHFDLHLLLENCIQLLQHLAQKKSLQLSLLLAPDLPQYVKGDPDRIRQILINLINNAIKFTDQGRIDVLVDLKNTSLQGFTLVCQVRDTGIGIRQENQHLLFEEFTMVDQTHSRLYEGAGLGLAICKRLVTLMNGEISVTSRKHLTDAKA